MKTIRLNDQTISTALTVMRLRLDDVKRFIADSKRAGDAEDVAYWELRAAQIAAAIKELERA